MRSTRRALRALGPALLVLGGCGLTDHGESDGFRSGIQVVNDTDGPVVVETAAADPEVLLTVPAGGVESVPASRFRDGCLDEDVVARTDEGEVLDRLAAGTCVDEDGETLQARHD